MTGPTISFRFRLKFDRDEVERFLKEHKRLQPVRFGYDVEYAEVLEYGCGPLKHFQPTYWNGDYTFEAVYEEIDRWARIKLGLTRKGERKAFVDRLMDRMWNRGLYPHPFYRPALAWLEENMQEQFDEGKSLYEICDEALKIADQRILEQGLPYTGQLQEGSIITTIPYAEAGDPKDDRLWVDINDRTKWERQGAWSSKRGKH